MFVKHCKVEVYLLELNLCENDNMDNVVTRHFSKADTIGEDSVDQQLPTHWETSVHFRSLNMFCAGKMIKKFLQMIPDTIEKEMRTLFNIPSEKETRLWNKYMSNTYEQLNKPDSTVQDAGLFQGQVT